MNDRCKEKREGGVCVCLHEWATTHRYYTAYGWERAPLKCCSIVCCQWPEVDQGTPPITPPMSVSHLHRSRESAAHPPHATLLQSFLWFIPTPVGSKSWPKLNSRLWDTLDLSLENAHANSFRKALAFKVPAPQNVAKVFTSYVCSTNTVTNADWWW